jgi:hypothetical protein
LPHLNRSTVDAAVQFDSKFDNASMLTFLDTLIVENLGICPERLHKDHVRDVIVSEVFATRCGWGMSPAQVVLYLELENRPR